MCIHFRTLCILTIFPLFFSFIRVHTFIFFLRTLEYAKSNNKTFYFTWLTSYSINRTLVENHWRAEVKSKMNQALQANTRTKKCYGTIYKKEVYKEQIRHDHLLNNSRTMSICNCVACDCCFPRGFFKWNFRCCYFVSCFFSL